MKSQARVLLFALACLVCLSHQTLNAKGRTKAFKECAKELMKVADKIHQISIFRTEPLTSAKFWDMLHNAFKSKYCKRVLEMDSMPSTVLKEFSCLRDFIATQHRHFNHLDKAEGERDANLNEMQNGEFDKLKLRMHKFIVIFEASTNGKINEAGFKVYF